MQITTEDFQRYARVALQWMGAALVSYGFVSPSATWVQPVIGGLISILTFFWTLYGNRVQAKINEVAKLDVVERVKVSDPATAAAGPVNVTT